MKTVWKYALKLNDTQEIDMPGGAEILHAGLDPSGDLHMWAKVDTNRAVETRTVHIRDTGNELPPDVRHVSTVLTGEFVWHVFV